MTYDELAELVHSVNGLTITSHVQNALFHTYTLYMNNEQILQRRWNRQIAVFTPSILQFRTRLHRQTTSHWSIESNGSTFRAIDIERLTIPERMHLDVYTNHTIYYIAGGNQETGESWTEIRDVATNHLLAIIDYQVPSRATFTGNHITFTTPNSRQNINADGMQMSLTNDDGSIRRIDLGRDGVTIEHDAVIPTESNWIVPGLNPVTTAADIERLTTEERDALSTAVLSHGNIMRFITSHNELTGETWTDIEYDGEVVARIDQRVHNVVSADGDSFVIGNPDLATLTITQRGLRWVRYHVTGEVSNEDATISGILNRVTTNTIHNITTDLWSWVWHNPRDAATTAALLYFNPMGIPRYIGRYLAIPAIISRIRPRLIGTGNITDSYPQTTDYSLQPLLDWCMYEGDDTDLDITMERADEYAISFDTCMSIAKTFRDSLKGPLALVCSKILDIEENGLPTVSSSNIEDIETRINTLERKTANIECEESTPPLTGELTLANLLKSYDERLKVLEAKCKNIE